LRRLFVLLLAAVALGCSKGNFSQTANAGNSGFFRYPMSSAPTTLDPAIVQDVDTGELLSNVFQGLVGYDENNRIVPLLAESWKLDNGGKTYLFTLRANAKFTNGRQVTADDVKWSLERATDKDFPSPTAQEYLTDIVGVEAKKAGKATGIAGIKVMDTRHLSITIDEPRAYFLGKLTYPCADVLAKEVTGSGPIKSLRQAIGTGPFEFSEYHPDQKITLVANKDYYLGAPLIQGLERPIVKDASTRINLFRGGNLDYVSLERQDVEGAEKDPKLKPLEQIDPVAAIYYMGLNQQSYPPFANKLVRRAFVMAVDRNKIATEDLAGMPVANGFLPPGITGYRPELKGIPFDVEGAKRLLAQAGYPDGKGLPDLTLSYRDQRPDAYVVSEAVGEMLKENLGVPIKLRTMEWGALLKARDSKQLQMVAGSWYADYLDPQNFLSFLLTTSASGNYDGYSNPEFDRLCAQADAESEPSKRIPLYQTAEDILIEDAARMPLYFDRGVSLVSPRVHGLRKNLFGLLPQTTMRMGVGG
jgi:oligopeptide transport system substrate-binding protein